MLDMDGVRTSQVGILHSRNLERDRTTSDGPKESDDGHYKVVLVARVIRLPTVCPSQSNVEEERLREAMELQVNNSTETDITYSDNFNSSEFS